MLQRFWSAALRFNVAQSSARPASSAASWFQSLASFSSSAVLCKDSNLIEGVNLEAKGNPCKKREDQNILARPNSAEKRMAMVFTCIKCDTRSVKTFSQSSYEKGVVLVRCPGCQKQHLIADNLGWFGDKHWTVEQLREQGTHVVRVPSEAKGPQGLTPNDLIGYSKVEQLLSQVSKSSVNASDGIKPSPPPSTPSDEGQVALIEQEGVIEVSLEELKQWNRVQGKEPPCKES